MLRRTNIPSSADAVNVGKTNLLSVKNERSALSQAEETDLYDPGTLAST